MLSDRLHEIPFESGLSQTLYLPESLVSDHLQVSFEIVLSLREDFVFLIATIFHKSSLTRNGITDSVISKDRSSFYYLEAVFTILTFCHQEDPAFLGDLEEPVKKKKKILGKVNHMS